MNSLRVAALQYFIRPVQNFEEFAKQVEDQTATASDYKAQLLVFPEYFTTQLLSIGNTGLPISGQIRELAGLESRIVELLAGLARKYKLTIVGGSLPGFDNRKSAILNKSYVFSPGGDLGLQLKLHMTRFESEEWMVTPGSRLQIFESGFGKFAVAICYDVEFPEVARVAARLGAQFLVVPSCTDDRQGYLRVRYCAQARAIENQMYVIHSPTVGSLPNIPDVSLNYGMAAIYSPSDYSFPRDGLLAEGAVNQESLVIGELNLSLIDETRRAGTVRPLLDSAGEGTLSMRIDHVKLAE